MLRYSVPHYHVVSHLTKSGKLSFIKNWIRKQLIEELYRRLGEYIAVLLQNMVTDYTSSHDVPSDWKLAHICR